VPTKDGVGSDERCNLGESPSSDGFTPNSESAALVVGQSAPSSTELLLEDSVLLSKIFDDRILLTGDPTGHGGYEDLPGVEYGCHPAIVAKQKTDRQLSTR
jgi:hypothetical protein